MAKNCQDFAVIRSHSSHLGEVWVAHGGDIVLGECDQPVRHLGLLLVANIVTEEREWGHILRQVPLVPVERLKGNVGDLLVHLSVLEECLVQVEVVARGVPTQAGQEKLRNIKFDGKLSPPPQLVQSVLFKDELFLYFFLEAFLSDLRQVTVGQDLEAVEGKGHEPGLVGRARGLDPHHLAVGQLATHQHESERA